MTVPSIGLVHATATGPDGPGWTKNARGGWLKVEAVRQRGQVVVTVSNRVGDEAGAPGHGMALHNLRERLRLLHDVAAQCDVWRDEEHGAEGSAAVQVFRARVILPAP